MFLVVSLHGVREKEEGKFHSLRLFFFFFNHSSHQLHLLFGEVEL